MDNYFKESNLNYAPQLHKPHVFFNSEYGYYECTDGGLSLFGNTPEEAYKEYSQVASCR